MAGSGGTSLAAAFAAAAKRHELRELMTTKRTNSILERRPGMLPLRTLQLGPSAAPADASSSVSPANSEHHRFAAALQAERLELSSENARLRRRVSELEQSVQLMQATAGAQRWLKSQGSGGATSWPPTATARVNSTAPKLRPKPTPCAIGPTSLHHRQILDAVERSQAEVASRPPPSPGERAANGSGEAAWTTAAWASSLRTSHIVADALLAPLGRAVAIGNSPLELAYVRALSACASRAAVLELLQGPKLLEALADELWQGMRRLIEAGCATGMEMHQKFVQEGNAFTMEFGGLSTYFGGLSELLGPPSPQVRSAMEREHCASADSDEAFESANYGVCTTPRLEYSFVIEPQARDASAWPAEATHVEPNKRRAPRTLASFAPELAQVNQRLRGLECAPLHADELCAARLYTGPMYAKYNATLRGVRSKNSKKFAHWYAGCKGNLYTTTMHVLNSAVHKASRLTAATTVYRGVSGGVLPASFWMPNEANVRGGVEWGFLSCTADYEVALAYAASRGGAGIVLELQQGMVDRGAELTWLSQYPYERECLLPPLTSIEVQSTRVDRGTLVVSCRPSVTRHEPIEQTVGKRLQLLREIAQGMQLEVSTAAVAASGANVSGGFSASGSGVTGARLGLEQLNKLIRAGPLAEPAEHYNDDQHFSSALSCMLALKREVLESLAVLPVHEPRVDLGGWSLKSPERVQMLCQWLHSSPAAKTLDLSRCHGLALEGARCLGAALRHNRVLETMTLGTNASLPVQQLLGHAPVRTLNLAHRNYGALAGCVISELIVLNTVLEVLDLSSNMLGQRADAGCIALSDVLRAQPSLRLSTLKLAKNYIGDTGALALAEALTHNLTLHTLDLSANEISLAAALELAAKLLANANPVQRLRLRGNGIDAAAAAELVHRNGLRGLAIEL